MPHRVLLLALVLAGTVAAGETVSIPHGEWIEELELAGDLAGREAQAFPRSTAPAEAHRLILTPRLVLRLAPEADRTALLARHRLRLVEDLAWAGALLVEGHGTAHEALRTAGALAREPGVLLAEPVVRRRWPGRAATNDPRLGDQWHLPLLNAFDAWDAANGSGVTIGVIDERAELIHSDLTANARTDLSWDFVRGQAIPFNAIPAGEYHATFVAGLAAARGDNATGVAGVAWGAWVASICLLGGYVSDQVDANALLHHVCDASAATQIMVSNNSWGPSDDGVTIAGPGSLARQALQTGCTAGRNGRGALYVWANGNGHPDDNSSYDGFANQRWVAAIGASRQDGLRSSFSETGCNLLVNAPGGDFGGGGMVSTDRTGSAGEVSGDYSSASDDLVGTSFATPVAAGVAALLLQTEPELTWRDAQEILARSAAQNDAADAGWATNGAGLRFNHQYGFGRVDADAAVSLAQTWTLLPPDASCAASVYPTRAIPNGTWTEIPITVAAPDGLVVEAATFAITVNHRIPGQLAWQLVSPAGTVSTVPRRSGDNALRNGLTWTFLSRAPLGEDAAGIWRLRVSDQVNDANNGVLTTATVRLHGWNPYAVPVITGAATASVPAGSDNTVTLFGSGFAVNASGRVTMSSATWDGTPVVATRTGSYTLALAIPAALAADGTFVVEVANPTLFGRGGGSSATFALTVAGGVLTAVGGLPPEAIAEQEAAAAAERALQLYQQALAEQQAAALAAAFNAGDDGCGLGGLGLVLAGAGLWLGLRRREPA